MEQGGKGKKGGKVARKKVQKKRRKEEGKKIRASRVSPQTTHSMVQ